MPVRFDYLELPAGGIGATRTFYEQAFDWAMTDFGGTYMATVTGDTDVGLFSDPDERPAARHGRQVALLEDADQLCRARIRSPRPDRADVCEHDGPLHAEQRVDAARHSRCDPSRTGGKLRAH